MKKLTLSILLVLVVLSIGSITQVSESQAIPASGPCVIAEQYGWAHPFWNGACELFLMDAECIQEGINCED